MVDHNLVVIDVLKNASSVTSLLGTFGVVGGELPEKFDPEAAPGSSPIIVICSEGGPSFENAPIDKQRVKVRVWAGINQFLKARQAFAALHDVLKYAAPVQVADGFMLTCVPDVVGQDVTDPDTGWATVLSYYEVTARQ